MTLMAVINLVLSALFFSLNTIWWVTLLTPVALVKLLVPVPAVRTTCTAWITAIAHRFNRCNVWWLERINPVQWRITVDAQLSPSGWYLLVCNHQSWVDILVLQKVFTPRIPLLKFFIKRELIYVPFLGFAWWALDFPFMRRKGGASAKKDLQAARAACEKFRHMPTSVISFLEGTRFTPQKHAEQHAPYAHLLKPKTGGISMALETMGDMFTSVLDVTIAYPQGVPTFTDLMAGRVREVVVHVRALPVPTELLSSDGSGIARNAMQAWTLPIWEAKDARLASMQAKA